MDEAPLETAEATAARQVPEWVGIAAVVIGASLLAFNAVSARIAYDGGTNVTTVLAARFALMALVFLLMARLLGARVVLSRRLTLAVLALGVSFTLASWGYIGSVAYIPAGFAVLLMYTYPLMVALGSRIVNREPFTPLKVLAMLAAFAGIGVMLGVSLETLSPRGVAMVLLGAACFAVCTVGGARLMRSVSVLTTSFYLSLVAAVSFTAFGLIADDFVLPVTRAGWYGAIGVALAFLFGFLGYFFGVKTIGETRAAVISNLEPVVGVLAAFALLGETFTRGQAAGAVLALGGVFVVVWEDARLRRRQPAPG